MYVSTLKSRIPPLKEAPDEQMSRTAPAQNVTFDDAMEDSTPVRSMESIFDELMDQVQCQPLNQAVENSLGSIFDAESIVLWVFDEKNESLFSATLSKSIPTEQGLIGASFSEGRLIFAEEQSLEEEYNAAIDADGIDPNSPVLLIPLCKRDGTSKAVLQIARNYENPFTDTEFAIAEYLYKKFQSYVGYLFKTHPAYSTAMKMVFLGTVPQTITKITNALSSFFKAKRVDIWMHSYKDQTTQLFLANAETPQVIPTSQQGIVATCIAEKVIVNEKTVKNGKLYFEAADGPGDEPGLYVPYIENEERIWVIAIHGRNHTTFFTRSDESQLMALAPFAIKSVSAAISPNTNIPHFEDLEQKLTALLEVAETLSGVLDIDVLIPTIMERACSLLDCERCSLFIVDKTKQELVTHFQAGLQQSIRIPMTRGIVGYTATTGNVVNIQDAYSDARFDRTIDTNTGYKTNSLLTVPIFNNRGEITGVTEMINKSQGHYFDDDDIRMMMAFNVFCGTSLDNAKLYKASIDLTRQLRTFIEMSSALNTTKTITDIITDILENARAIVSASRATLFIYDNNENSLSPLVNVGDELKFGTTFAQDTIKERSAKLYDSQEIAKMTQTQQLESAIEKIINESDSSVDEGNNSERNIKSSGRVSTVLHSNPKLSTKSNSSYVDISNDSNHTIICSIPLMNSEQIILGVMELLCKWKVVSEDMKLLDCFAVFASVSIERNQLKEVTTVGQRELELKRWINKNERSSTNKNPNKLILPDDQLNQLWTINFDAPMWDGIGHFRVLFAIFYKFNLMSEFNISNEKFFRFIYEVRQTYKKVPYHNWRHAVDVTQFVTYELITSQYDQVLTKFELFGLMVSAICHDANHDGFTNVYNVKAETPLGILFKNQSVMETHHCTISIEIISKEECNLFETLNAEDYKKMWNLIIQLILATDMARHFDLLKQFAALKDSNQFSLDIPENRILLMQLILKCGDISNVSRPFLLADKWCDVLCEEFFRQGDLEMANGMEYTSPLNDRSHLDKPKSQIGFYSFVCLPLYQATARAIPKLDVNVQQVQSNLAIWKKAQEEAEAAPPVV